MLYFELDGKEYILGSYGKYSTSAYLTFDAADVPMPLTELRDTIEKANLGVFKVVNKEINGDIIEETVFEGYSVITTSSINRADNIYSVSLSKAEEQELTAKQISDMIDNKIQSADQELRNDLKTTIDDAVNSALEDYQPDQPSMDGPSASPTMFTTLCMFAMPDEHIYEVKDVFEAWNGDHISYTKDYIVSYNGLLYRVITPHISQSDWTPDSAVSLFVEIPDPNIEWPEWKQPDSVNPYMKGDKVIYKGNKYISTMDGNIWSPDAYPAGWEKQ